MPRAGSSVPRWQLGVKVSCTLVAALTTGLYASQFTFTLSSYSTDAVNNEGTTTVPGCAHIRAGVC